MSIILFGLSYFNKDKIINYGDKQGGVLNNKKLDIKESGISTSFVRDSTTKSNSKTIPTEINDSRTGSEIISSNGTVVSRTDPSGTVVPRNDSSYIDTSGTVVPRNDSSYIDTSGTVVLGNDISRNDISGNGSLDIDTSEINNDVYNYIYQLQRKIEELTTVPKESFNNDVYNYISQLLRKIEELKTQLEKSKEITEINSSENLSSHFFKHTKEIEELKKQLEKSKEITEINSSENLSNHFLKHTKEIEDLKKKLEGLGIDKSDELNDLILQLYQKKEKAEQLLQRSKELPENDSIKLKELKSKLQKLGLNINNENLDEKINKLKEYQDKLEGNFLKQKNISKEYEVEKNILLNKLNKIKINIENLREDEKSEKIKTLTEIENLKKEIEVSKKMIFNLKENSSSKDEEIIELQNYTKNLESLFFQLNIEKKKLILMNTMKEKEKYLKDIENQFEKSQLKNKFNLFKCFIDNYFEIEEIKDNAIKIDEKLNLIYKLNNLKEDFKKEKNNIIKNTNDNQLKNFINNLSKDFKQKIKGLLEELTKNVE